MWAREYSSIGRVSSRLGAGGVATVLGARGLRVHRPDRGVGGEVGGVAQRLEPHRAGKGHTLGEHAERDVVAAEDQRRTVAETGRDPRRQRDAVAEVEMAARARLPGARGRVCPG
ncbi:MAG: hypothetical protein ABS81_08035 [Pseudonocardia sp. SCN 72-86]|nr:MAG: hypothetical protein ABS81_08035 [Pseudonocardia sp. SCN 72-86]